MSCKLSGKGKARGIEKKPSFEMTNSRQEFGKWYEWEQYNVFLFLHGTESRHKLDQKQDVLISEEVNANLYCYACDKGGHK